MVLRPLRGVCIGKSRMNSNWWIAAASLAAGMSNSCWVRQVLLVEYKTPGVGGRLPWTAVLAHLTDGVAFSVFHADPSDKGLVHRERVMKPSFFHSPPPEFSSKSFLQEKQGYVMPSSAIPNLSSCMLLDGGSHWGVSERLLSSAYLCDKTVSPLFCLSTNSLQQIIVFPSLYFKLT